MHQRHRIRQQAFAAAPSDEAAQSKFGGVAREAIDHGCDAEQGKTDRDAVLAADSVGQTAKQQGTEHHAKQRVAVQRAGLQESEPLLRHQHRQHHAIDE